MAKLHFEDYSKYFIPTPDGVLVDADLFSHRQELGERVWELLSLWSRNGNERTISSFEYVVDDVFLSRRQFDAIRNRIFPALVTRDGEKCALCGSLYDLTIDHVLPLSKGGTNDLDNLRILCRFHNSQKGAK